MNPDLSILMITIGTLLYMFLGYKLVKALSRRKDMNPSVMMAGYDALMYEEGREYGRRAEKDNN